MEYKKYILQYYGNWNDEITVDGYVLIDSIKKNKIEKILKEYEENITISVGDLDIEYDNGNELLDEISFIEMSDDEEKIIDKYFGKYNDFGYNLFLNIDKLHEEIDII